eukprot:5694340-Prymnesium_polylepis.1
MSSARSARSTESLPFQRPSWEEWQGEVGRRVPEVKIFFLNAHYAATAPKQHELPVGSKLPEEIEFYVSTKSAGPVPFPLPSYYPQG